MLGFETVVGHRPTLLMKALEEGQDGPRIGHAAQVWVEDLRSSPAIGRVGSTNREQHALNGDRPAVSGDGLKFDLDVGRDRDAGPTEGVGDEKFVEQGTLRLMMVMRLGICGDDYPRGDGLSGVDHIRHSINHRPFVRSSQRNS